MKTCGEGCIPVCDFCAHCEHLIDSYLPGGIRVQTGLGLCHHKNEVVDISGACDDYYCVHAEGAIRQSDTRVVECHIDAQLLENILNLQFVDNVQDLLKALREGIYILR